MGCRSPSPAGCCVFGSSRWLVQSEDGWEEHVQKLPQEIEMEFHAHCDRGRAALDMDDWHLAVSEYEICRGMLLSLELDVEGHDSGEEGEEKARDREAPYLKKQTHDWLTTWVDLPLALLYQYRAKRLDDAHMIWKEILECVRPLQASESGLVAVVESFVETSLYEWTCSGNFPPLEENMAAAESAIKHHALSNNWDEKEAESHLCLLLSFDHYYFGSWHVGLRWIQAAKRLWEQNLPERKEYDHVFLRCEAELLIKLLKFDEARALLLNWLDTTDELHNIPWHTARVHRLLYECYTDWSWWIAEHGDADENQVELYKNFAHVARMDLTWMLKVEGERHLGFGGQFSLVGLKFEDKQGNFLLPEESKRRLGLPSTLGCSSVLNLTNPSVGPSQEEASNHLTSSVEETTKFFAKMKNHQDDTDASLEPNLVQEPTQAQSDTSLDYHLQKLPLELGVAFCIHADCGRAALEEGDWEEAIVQYQMCRQMLKLTRRAMETGTHDWLLAWINLPLARLYQYRAKKFHKAFQMRREMLDCVRPEYSDWRRLPGLSLKGVINFPQEWLNAWGLNSDNPGDSDNPGVSKMRVDLGSCNHTFLKEKMRQMLYWIRPSRVDMLVLGTLGRLADLEVSDPENPEYLIRRRRSKSVSREQCNKSLAETIRLNHNSRPFYFLKDMPLEYIFESFCCITLYEWACAECPKMKNEVIKKYYEVGLGWLTINENEAEPHLCMQLHFDHSLVGSLEISLHWIQEAKQVLKKNIPYDWKNQCYFAETILFNEATLMMKLSRWEEANQALSDWIRSTEVCEGTSSHWTTTRTQFLIPSQERSLPFQLLQQRCLAEMIKEAALAGDQEGAKEHAKTAQMEVGPEVFICGPVPHWQRLMLDRETIDFNEYIVQSSQQLEGLNDLFGEEDEEFSTYLSLFVEMLQNYQKYIQTETWSETDLPKDDKNFFQAVQSIEKCLKVVEKRLDSSVVDTLNYNLTKTYEHFELMNLKYFLEKANVIMSANALDQQGGPSAHAMKELLLQFDVKAYLASTSPIVEIGRKVLLQIADKLYTMTNLFSKGWITMQENHKEVYDCLQFHYHRKYHIDLKLHKIMGTNQELTHENREKSKYSAFLWSERRRARVMLYQVGPNKLSSSAARDLRAFDTDDAFAMETLHMKGTTLEKGVVFVEYSYAKRSDMCLIFVRNQDGDLSMDQEIGEQKDEIEERLKNLLTYMNPRKNKKNSPQQDMLSSDRLYGDDDMHKDLEWFYDLLIKPIAHHLTSMKPEHKLIFAPNEQLNKVPFAALRDSTKPPGQGYLIQSHTISLTPSLRVLKKCHERLQALHKLPLYPGPGSIVALGDPAYGKFLIRKILRLKSSAKEVECIEALFGEARVVKLLGTDATAESLLQWAQKPSCDEKQSFRQALFHIGAHGYVHWKQYSNGVLYLAHMNAKPYPPDEAKFTATNDTISRDCSEFSEEDECDSDDDNNFPQISTNADSLEAINNLDIYRSTSATSTKNLSIKSGELKAEQISGCKFEWAAEMVILSACNTAIGEISAEGVLSLARAFMMAGAPCVVASQWKVMDESTSILMEGFYRNLKSGKDVASALRTSMLTMIHNGAYKVHHWAPFTVWGLPTVCLPQALQDPQST